MRKTLLLAAGAILLGAWLGKISVETSTLSLNESRAGALTPAEARGSLIAQAVGKLLAGLNDEQRGKASFAYEDKERINWHFIPRPRKGLAIKDLDAAGKALVTDCLAASLSAHGVKTVEQVRSLEAVLAKIEGPNRRFPRDPELYFVSVFGKPAKTGAWAWRFEGHHLCLNFHLDGHELVSATPLFFGANPAEVMDGPQKGLRVLGPVEDVARQLVSGLDEKLRDIAIGKEKPKEVEGTQAAAYAGERPQGLTLDKLDDDGKKLLRKLVGLYVKHLDDDTKKSLRRAIRKSDLSKTHLVWRGSLEPGKGHSYIIHSPDHVISYANFQNNAKHVHAAFRALKGEFGAKPAGE